MTGIKNNPLISIALTIYNGEKFLYQQLESIANQTYKNIEVVIVDDCSADRSLEIIEHFKEKINIRLYKNEINLGILKNFEKAILLCKGDFIALSDQDDVWELNKIERLLYKIKNYVLICSDTSIIDEDGEKIADSWRRYQLIEIPSERNQFKKIIFQNFALGCTTLFRKELKELITPIPLQAEGHDWWIALIATLNGKIKFIDEALVKKRLHSSNFSNLYNDSILNRFKKYFSRRHIQERKRHYENSVSRIRYCLRNNIYRLNEEKKFLEDMLDFYSSYPNNIIHLKSFIIAYKYRNILYEKYSPIERFLHIVAKLV